MKSPTNNTNSPIIGSPTVASPAESSLTQSVKSGESSPPKELGDKLFDNKEVISTKPPLPNKPVTVSINGFDISITQSPMKSKKMTTSSNNSIATTNSTASTTDASTMTDDNVELSDISKRMKENKEYIRAKREEK